MRSTKRGRKRLTLTNTFAEEIEEFVEQSTENIEVEGEEIDEIP